MGVTGLHSYICEKRSLPAIREAIDFRAEIEIWKARNEGRPKIIIDMKEIVHTVVQNDFLGLHLGGRYATHLHFFRQFFEALKAENVDLIFFAVGKNLRHELDLFIPNQKQVYKRYLNVLNKFDAKKRVRPSIRNRKMEDARAPITMYYNMHKLAREFGELHINYVQHNQEIAKYMQQHSGTVLSIITNDNDFMVFDGDFQFWQANDVNMKALTGVRKCREKLRAQLHLNSKQLQLMSALSGSFFLPKIRLTRFYQKIKDARVGEHYVAHLAEYIREKVKLISNDNGDPPCFDLAAIAGDIFGQEYAPNKLDLIKKGLEQYDLNFEPIDMTSPTKMMKYAKTRNMFIHKLLTDEVYLIVDIKFIDYRHFRSKNYADLIVPLLRKVYGILLANEPQRPQERAICMKYSHEESYKVQKEPIVYPPIQLPDLFALIFQPKNKRHASIRWTLFQWLFGFEIDFIRSVKGVHKQYFAVLTTIKYLLQEGEITIDEADAFLTTESHSINLKRPRMTTELPQTLNPHYIRIAHLYAKIYCLVCHCIEVCGLPLLTEYLMFDGQFFHKTLEEFASCPDKKAKALELIMSHRIYVN